MDPLTFTSSQGETFHITLSPQLPFCSLCCCTALSTVIGNFIIIHWGTVIITCSWYVRTTPPLRVSHQMELHVAVPSLMTLIQTNPECDTEFTCLQTNDGDLMGSVLCSHMSRASPITKTSVLAFPLSLSLILPQNLFRSTLYQTDESVISPNQQQQKSS